MKRSIVEIDQDKCNGCGQCVPNCAEGALRIVDGKARLVSDVLCDGLGACLGHCPQDAIRIVERDAPGFDETAATSQSPPIHGSPTQRESRACPGSRASMRTPVTQPSAESSSSQLAQWPIQLHLVPVNAPFFGGAGLLIAAPCVPFAHAGFHGSLLAGKALVIACPKLDNTGPYLEKLTQIIARNGITSLTVAVMEVPCCQGLVKLARQALHDSGKRMPITVEVIGVNGERK